MDLLGYDLWLEPPASPYLTPQAHYRTGGGERDRTDDLMLAKHALSQLSYTPGSLLYSRLPRLVGLDGFEPSTPALSRRCSNQLSYRPGLKVKNQARGLKLQVPDPKHFMLRLLASSACLPYNR